MASSKFNASLKGRKKNFDSMKNAERRGFVLPTIEDGTYIFKVTAECGNSPKKDVPFVKLTWKIQDDERYFNTGSDTVFWLDGDNEEIVDRNFENLALALKALLDIEELVVEDATDIEHFVSMVNEADTYCRGRLNNWEAGEKRGFNVYFNEKVNEVVA